MKSIPTWIVIIASIVFGVIGFFVGHKDSVVQYDTKAYDSLVKVSDEKQRVSDSVIYAQSVIIRKSDSNYNRLQKSRNYISNKYLTLYNEIHTTTIDSVLLIRDSLLSGYDKY